MAGKESASSELNLIATGTVVEGKIKTSGSIRIDGRVLGDINATQNASIGPTGEVTGNVTAKNVNVAGKVNGSMVALEKLVFEPEASVTGDIRAAKLVVNEGAKYDGQCQMSQAKDMPNLVELRQESRRAEGR